MNIKGSGVENSLSALESLIASRFVSPNITRAFLAVHKLFGETSVISVIPRKNVIHDASLAKGASVASCPAGMPPPRMWSATASARCSSARRAQPETAWRTRPGGMPTSFNRQTNCGAPSRTRRQLSAVHLQAVRACSCSRIVSYRIFTGNKLWLA